MIATRFVPAICALVALALVPTLIHSYSDTTADDGRRTTAIPITLAGFEAVPSDRADTWGKRRFDSDDWVEREYRHLNGDRARLTIVRSYDAKSLYHHPELAVAYGTGFVRARTEYSDARPDVPLHVLDPAPGVRAAALYVLHYQDRFIDNPILFQLRTAGELLFSRRAMMTLFFMTKDGAPDGQRIERSGEMALLFAAIDAFVAQTVVTR